MDITQAKEIVSMLANGVNPVTGEVFPTDSHYNDPMIIRALFTILDSLSMSVETSTKSNEEKILENIYHGRPKNAGLHWVKDERDRLAILFKKGKSIDELSNYFERSKGAIRSELSRQGLI